MYFLPCFGEVVASAVWRRVWHSVTFHPHKYPNSRLESVLHQESTSFLH